MRLTLNNLTESMGAMHTSHFYFRGKKFAVRTAGMRVLRLLLAVRRAEENGYPLLTLRTRIRRVLDSAPPVLMCYLLQRVNSEVQLRLLIWILGKQAKRFAAKSVHEHHAISNRKVRIEVVRTLQRMSAWHELQLIERDNPYEETRKSACPTLPDQYSARLARFTSLLSCTDTVQLSDQEIGAKAFVADDVQIPSNAATKDGQNIRRFLRRIRVLVSLSTYRRGRFWPFS